MNNVHTLTSLINHSSVLEQQQSNTVITSDSTAGQITNILKLRGHPGNPDLSSLELEVERIQRYTADNPTTSFNEAFPNFEYILPTSINTDQQAQSMQSGINVDFEVENTEEVVSLFEIIKNIYGRLTNSINSLEATDQICNESEIGDLENTIESLTDEILKDPDSEHLRDNIKEILNKAEVLKEKLKANLENISDQITSSFTDIGNMTVNQVINTALHLDLSNIINSTELTIYPIKFIPTLFIYRGIIKLFLKHCDTKKDILNNKMYSFEQRLSLMRQRHLNVGVTMLFIAPVVTLVLLKNTQLNIFDAFNVKFKRSNLTTNLLPLNPTEVGPTSPTQLLAFLVTLFKSKKNNPNWFKFIVLLILSFFLLFLLVYLLDLVPYLIVTCSIIFTIKNFLIISILAAIIALIYNLVTYILISIFQNQDQRSCYNFKLEKSLDFKVLNYILNPIVKLATCKDPNIDLNYIKIYSLKHIILYTIFIISALYFI